ncbi:MAG: phosphoserine transaminase [Bacteriovoracaceae bacterium]|nr:phosphoserine transaminase [Bacteriovoracaceae bacterium]
MFENYNAPSDLIPSDPRFGCGPSLIPVQFVKDLADTGVHLLGTSHRKQPVKDLVKGIQEGLRTYFNVPSDYTIAVGNGGATFLFDMIALGIVEKKATHFTCGEFSQKWFKSSKLVPWIEAEEVSVEYGKGITPELISGSDLIACTLNETSTGVQLDQIPGMDENTILAVDATSGGGQCPMDVSKTDMYFFSPQKVFASEGGLFVCIMSPKARERALKLNDDKSRYIPGIMNWKTCLDNSDKNQTYNTPAISTLYFLNEQIKLMNKEGYEAVQEEAQKKADLVYGWAEEKPYLSCFIEEPKYRSVSVATINVDEKIDVNGLLKKLGSDKIVYGIDSYRKLGKNQFRIGLFHNIKLDDLNKLTRLLSNAIESVL